jgi:hypothetical protein
LQLATELVFIQLFSVFFGHFTAFLVNMKYVPKFAVVLSAFLCLRICNSSEPSNDSQRDFSSRQLETESETRIVSTITQQDLDRCTASLEQVATDGAVGRDEFITFLEDFSGRSLVFEGFLDLPLSLILIFYTAACSSGRDCVNQEPVVSVDHVGVSQGLLAIFCTAVRDVVVVQINFRFQYQIRYQDGTMLDHLLQGSLKEDVEQATELVLLNQFGCDPNLSQRRMREELFVAKRKADPDNEDPSAKPQTASGNMTWEQSRQREQRIELPWRELQLVALHQCNYRVQARVLNAFEFGE